MKDTFFDDQELINTKEAESSGTSEKDIEGKGADSELIASLVDEVKSLRAEIAAIKEKKNEPPEDDGEDEGGEGDGE